MEVVIDSIDWSLGQDELLAIRHAVFSGTSKHGGVVAVVGDDPAAKSSTLPSSSDATMVDLHMPVLDGAASIGIGVILAVTAMLLAALAVALVVAMGGCASAPRGGISPSSSRRWTGKATY